MSGMERAESFPTRSAVRLFTSTSSTNWSDSKVDKTVHEIADENDKELLELKEREERELKDTVADFQREAADDPRLEYIFYPEKDAHIFLVGTSHYRDVSFNSRGRLT